jgi:hypothetical protein
MSLAALRALMLAEAQTAMSTPRAGTSNDEIESYDGAPRRAAPPLCETKRGY